MRSERLNRILKPSDHSGGFFIPVAGGYIAPNGGGFCPNAAGGMFCDGKFIPVP